jgi:hypothetical protein
VLHIGRFARRTSVNFVPVGDYVEIHIWVRGSQEPITLTNPIGLAGTGYRLEEMYRSVSERTFTARSAYYLTQLEKTGYIDYGNARFFTNGDIESKKLRLSLKSSRLSLEPFELIVTEPGRSSSRQIIDLAPGFRSS